MNIKLWQKKVNQILWKWGLVQDDKFLLNKKLAVIYLHRRGC